MHPAFVVIVDCKPFVLGGCVSKFLSACASKPKKKIVGIRPVIRPRTTVVSEQVFRRQDANERNCSLREEQWQIPQGTLSWARTRRNKPQSVMQRWKLSYRRCDNIMQNSRALYRSNRSKSQRREYVQIAVPGLRRRSSPI